MFSGSLRQTHAQCLYLIACSFLSNISGVFCSCDTDADESGEGGVARGDGPLHCISLRQCSARAISAASHSGSSGRMYFKAERSPSITCCDNERNENWAKSQSFEHLPRVQQSRRPSVFVSDQAKVSKLVPTIQSTRN